MNKTEVIFWLLETAATGKVPLSLIGLSDQELVSQWNKKPHGVSSERVGDILWFLFQQKDVCFVDKCGHPASPTQLELGAEIVRRGWAKDSMCYGLTPQGGSRWEALAAPNWNHFFDGTWISEEELAIETRTKVNLHRVLRYGAEYWNKVIDLKSLSCEVVRPWQATYWKTFPRAILAHVKCREVLDQEIQMRYGNWTPEEVKDHHQFLHAQLYCWYQMP